MPEGSNTGAGFSGQSGALDMGQRASTGLTTFNAFWAYIVSCFSTATRQADREWRKSCLAIDACGARHPGLQEELLRVEAQLLTCV
jgi:hypothetical protein